MVSCGLRFSLLICFSLILFVLGFVFLLIGVHIQFEVNNGNALTETYFVQASIFVFSLSSTMIVIAIFGFCVAFLKNYCVFTSLGILMTGIFIFGSIGTLMYYADLKQIQNDLRDKTNSTMFEYNTNVIYKNFWDTFQNERQCCGIYGPFDWKVMETKAIPRSCCKILPFDDFPVFDCTERNAFTNGCYPLISEIFEKHTFSFRTATLMIYGGQIFIIHFIFFYARTIRTSNKLRKGLLLIDNNVSAMNRA